MVHKQCYYTHKHNWLKGISLYSTQWIYVFQYKFTYGWNNILSFYNRNTVIVPFSKVPAHKSKGLWVHVKVSWMKMTAKGAGHSQWSISLQIFNLFLACFPKEMRQQWDVYQFPSVLFYSLNTFPHQKLLGSVAIFNILQSNGVLKDSNHLQLPCTVYSPGTRGIGNSKWIGKQKRGPE